MDQLVNSKILIVEDDARLSESLRYLFYYHGCDVQISNNLFDALSLVHTIEFDLIILDLKLEDQSGFALMDYLAVKELHTQVIIITGQDFESNAITAIKKGAADYLKKPFDPDSLLESVKKVLHRLNDYREKEHVSTLILSSREKFRNVVDSQTDYLCRLSRDFEITFVNKAFADFYRKTPKEMIGRAYKSFFHETIRPRLFDKLAKLRSGSGPIQIEYKFMFKNRRSGYQRWRFQGVLDEKGEMVEIQCTGRDITEEHLLRRRLVARAEKYRRLLEKSLHEETKKLKHELNKTKHLSGMLVICSSCKMIRDDKGHWNQLEPYIMDRSEVEFSHGICPRCTKKLYPELFIDETLPEAH